jgi:hypothetical protein
VDGFFERMILGAATIDELLSNAFEPVRGQRGDSAHGAGLLQRAIRPCSDGGWSAMAWRSQRCEPGLPGLVVAPPPLRHPGSTMPYGLKRRCNAQPRTRSRLLCRVTAKLVHLSTFSRV